MESESEFEQKFFAAGAVGAELGADVDSGGAGSAADVAVADVSAAPALHVPSDDPFGYGGDSLGGLDDATSAVRARRLERYHESLRESNVGLEPVVAAGSDSSSGAAASASEVSSALTVESSGFVLDKAASTPGGVCALSYAESSAAAAARKDEGNRAFSAGDMAAATAAYTEALALAPRHEGDVRAVYFCNRAAAHLALDEYEPALWDCDRALELKPAYVKALARRARALERLGLLDEALRDARAVAACEGSGAASAREVDRLSTLVAARDEKLKTEMFGKLKDLGNSVLGWFGMSVDNFKAVKDPQTGSYSLSFQQNSEK